MIDKHIFGEPFLSCLCQDMVVENGLQQTTAEDVRRICFYIYFGSCPHEQRAPCLCPLQERDDDRDRRGRSQPRRASNSGSHATKLTQRRDVELHPKAASVPIGDADDDDELEVPIEATFIGQGVVYFFCVYVCAA